MRVIRYLFLIPLVLLFGCQPPTAPTPKTVSIEWTGWYVQNVPNDWWIADGKAHPTLLYQFSAQMSKNTLSSDVASFDVYLPGSKTDPWSFPPNYFDETSHGWGQRNTNAYLSENGAALPLGTMDVVVTLSDGRKLNSSIVSTQPGSTQPGPTMVANEDSIIPYSNKVAALPRPVVTSAVKNTANATLTIQFTENDPAATAYNGWVWLYDGAGEYLGGFFYFRPRAVPHTPVVQLNSGLGIKTNNTTNVLALTQADLITGAGTAFTTTQFGNIASVRVVVCDGGQYASGTGIYYDYRSVSSGRTVN